MHICFKQSYISAEFVYLIVYSWNIEVLQVMGKIWSAWDSPNGYSYDPL